MKTLMRLLLLGLILNLAASWAQAPGQSNAPDDRAVSQRILSALGDAGIDPRVTSVQVTTTAGHLIRLTGLISDKGKIKLAVETAAKAAPGYRIVNDIRSSFFDDPNHIDRSRSK